VPLYNDGQAAATSAIYEVAARGVVALGPDLNPAAREPLERALRRIEHESDRDARAWVLRRAIDDSIDALETHSRRMMSSR
jgi:hypothetical protein